MNDDELFQMDADRWCFMLEHRNDPLIEWHRNMYLYGFEKKWYWKLLFKIERIWKKNK